MKELSPQLVARLAAWKTSPHPIHQFVSVNWSQDAASPAWRHYSSFPQDITVGGNVYSRDSGLQNVGDVAVRPGASKSAFTFAVLDRDGYIESVADAAEYRGLPLTCDIHFSGSASEIRGGLYKDREYEGTVDGLDIYRTRTGLSLAVVGCGSPFLALDEMQGRMGSKEHQRIIDPTDTAYDEAIKSAGDSDLKWGQHTNP